MLIIISTNATNNKGPTRVDDDPGRARERPQQKRSSAGHFGTKIMYLAQFLMELLRILSFKTCIMKN